MKTTPAIEYPNQLPRPPSELAELKQVWELPRGWRVVTAVNNTIIGYFYIGTAFLFFLLAGVLALLMRTQLAVPSNTFLSPETYNQVFTMHGTVMMFLFAVPVVEAMGVMLLPQMLGARDLPFPRLSAFAFWAYFVGGLVFFSTLFFDLAPSGGWSMYPPLTGNKFSPGAGADFWLLGIGFIEISAIAGAIEIIVGVLRTRAPGMSLARMPMFAWTMLIFAGMIVVAFPAIILATMMLELERAFGWPFFIAEEGGDPLLWQHLFWFFGHPEVYIIFLPAAGMVSMIVPTMARTPLVGYELIVVALIATGFFSFGLWVHHMFTTGIPSISLGFFSAASMAVSLPSGIQMFAWIATLASGRLQFRTPSLFVLGFIFIFTLGGLTGVMVAMVPFDWQAHDTYFVVAHFHYVLVGGMVFPLFAALYYWMPAFSRNALSERLGTVTFGLMFVGFNVAFLPMHLTGLLGMPRRVHTYSAELGWDTLNMVSTIGAFTFAAGVIVFLLDLARHFRPAMSDSAGNIWKAGTLEWLPNNTYAARSVPRVTDREPLWADPTLNETVDAGRWYLPGTATGWRETIMTSALDATPQYVLRLPGPSWTPFLAAVFTAAFFLILTVKFVVPAMICGVLAIVMILIWMWPSDPPSSGKVDIGGGIRLPTHVSGPLSHSWSAMVILLLVAGALYLSWAFSYLYVWTVSPGQWPKVSGELPPSIYPALATALLLASGGAIAFAGRFLRKPAGNVPVTLLLGTGLALLLGGIAVEAGGQWSTGWRPDGSGYAALVGMNIILQTQLTLAVVLMGLFAIARRWAGRLNHRRRAVYDNVRILWLYTVAQSLFGLLIVHGFPRAA